MGLFRIINFYELVDTLTTSKLRVPSAAQFSDQNELAGNLFSTLKHPMFSPYTDDGVEKLFADQNAFRESHYISCWTKRRDSVAMWEIYSPDHCSVQIEMDEDALKDAFKAHFHKNCFANARDTLPGDKRVFFYPPRIGECKYKDLRQFFDGARKNFRLNESALKDAQAAGDSTFSAAWEEFIDIQTQDILDDFFIKDEAYLHECEIRFCLHSVCRNDREYEDCKSDQFFVLFDTHLRPTRVRDVGPNIFIDIPLPAIINIWTDGRSPPWISTVQASILKSKGFNCERSPAYGPFVDAQDAVRWWRS